MEKNGVEVLPKNAIAAQPPETWVEETPEGSRTCYSFYQKPMANPVVIPALSAVPDSTKFATFRQEVGRIL